MNILISLFIGAILSIMIFFNGILSQTVGNYVSLVIIHFVGLIGIIIICVIKKCNIRFRKNLPLYLYSAGAIGIITVLFTNLNVVALGVSTTTALGLLGQSISSIVIDHYGLLRMKTSKFNKKKYIGLFLISIGILVMTIF